MNRSQRRLLSRVSARAALLMTATLGLSSAPAADLEEEQTAITGTENLDTLAISTAQNADATLTSVEGGTTTATATGVDALEGDDAVNGDAAITANADASAAIVALPKPGTVNATATGVSAGDGDDVVAGPLAITATAAAQGAYAGAIDWSVQNPTQPPQKKIEAGVTTNATAAGIETGEGDDDASNDGTLTISADAVSGGGAAPLSAETNQSTEVHSKSEANATATAFDTGAGSDIVTNNGTATNSATATSGALSVSLVAPQGGATDPKPGKTQIKTEATASATATAVGINADSEESEDSDEDTREYDTSGLRYTLDKSSTAVAGNDAVTNNVLLDNTATAVAGAGSATISNKVDGTLSATATAEATAETTGVITGGGDDVVTNAGILRSHSTATGGALSVSIDIGAPRADGPPTPPGDTPTPPDPSEDRESKASSNTSVTASATATGINTEAGASESLTRLAEITRSRILLDEEQTATAAAGNDIVTNTGEMETVAEATVDSLNASVTLSSGGSANADSSSNATADATGIITGAGDDEVTNEGEFTVSATSMARAATLALAAGSPNAAPPSGSEPAPNVSVSANTSVESTATAMGIDTEGPALSTESTRHLSIDSTGLRASRGSAQSGAAGNDVVTNTGAMSVIADATAGAGTAAAALGAAGSVSAESSANATASSTLIYTGAANDAVSNTELLASEATATAAAISIGVAASKPAPASSDGESEASSVSVKAGSSATAAGMGIDTEGTGHNNSEDQSVSLTRLGLEVVRVRESTSQSGTDTVVNTGELRTSAEATSITLAGGVQVGAEGSVGADATAKSEATNTAIYTGGGDDQIDNDALVQSTADAEALSIALSVSVSQPSAGSGNPPAEPEEEETAKTQATANAEANSRAVGIDADGEGQDQEAVDILRIDEDGLLVSSFERIDSSGGHDHIVNGGEVNAAATSRAGAGAVSVGIQSDGTTAASTNSTARASSGALLTGFGSDVVDNQGTLTSTADSEAGAVSVAFSMSNEAGSRAKADSNSISESSAIGISTAAEALGRERELDLFLNRDGIQLDFRQGSIADNGVDRITNEGEVTANASARSGTIAAGVAIDGATSAEANATANSRAHALTAGGGPDRIFNIGHLDAGATSESIAIAAAIGTNGGEKTRTEDSASVNSTANAESFGIRSDNGRNELLEGSVIIDSTGLRATVDYQTVAVSSDDMVSNAGRIDSSAVAESHAGGVAVTIDGIAKTEVNSSASTRSTGIDSGGGSDLVQNHAIIVSDAFSQSEAVGVSVGANRNPGGKARVETNSSAAASSTGISTDGARVNQSIESDLAIDAGGLRLTANYANSAATGNDQLDNRSSVTANADASTLAASIAVSIKGSANASTKSAAQADATALNTGAGADQVTNTGQLTAHADAGAITIEAAVSKGGSAISTSGILSAGTEASARATGIAAAGIDATENLELDEQIDFDNASVSLSAAHSLDAISADGIDTVTNSGAITATSDVSAIEVTAGITSGGTALTMSRTTSEAIATGIDTGHLGDTVVNSATLTTRADVEAVAVKASVSNGGAAIAANAVWDGGTQVAATSRGIDADGGERVTRELTAEANADLGRVRYTRETTAASGNDTVRNTGNITTTASSEVISASVSANAGSGAGLALTVSTSTAEADAIALRGGDGNDSLENDNGTLTVSADATAATVNVALSNAGLTGAADAVWDGGTKANANAIGIAGDGGERSHSREWSIGTDGLSYDDDGVLADGADTIDNDGAVNATANSLAASVAVAMTARGVAVATATSTSTANAAAIDAGQGTAIDNVTNRGSLAADADAQAYTASVSVVNNGVALAAGSVWDGGTKADSRARGIDVGAGGETITNSGAITSTATSTTLEVAVAAAVNGFAAAVATTTGTADASGIDASAGDDVDHITNDGTIDAHASSTAISAALTFTNNGVSVASDAAWDGGTHSTARARGIDVGAGADTITNTRQVRAEGDALGVSAAFSASVNGVAVAATTATTLSDVAALDAGAGDVRDTITNSGRLIADSNSSAAAASLSVTMNGAAVAAAGSTWDGGTSSTANATGAILGGGDDVITDTAGTFSDADSFSLSASVGLTMNGLSAAISAAQSEANAKGIDAGTGNDSLTTSAAAGMRADATSDAYGIALTATQNGVSASGNNTWDGGTQSRANARVLDGGAGTDTINNSSALASTTFARSLSAAVALTGAGVAVANSTATSTADAAAIDGGDDADDIDNTASLTVNSQSEARGINVSITGGGVAIAADSVWDGGTTANALGHGIRGGAGNDSIDNLNAATAIDARSRAEALSVAVSISGTGFAGATSSSTANAAVAAIDAGIGNDVINNAATAEGRADATATSVAVTVSGTGAAVATDAFWDGGTKATAVSSALAGGAGNDTITNTGNALADSDSTTLSAAISLSLSPSFGLAAASSASTATSNATVLDGGAGNDIVSNSALLTAQGSSNARGVSVALTTSGAAVVGAFDAATRANSSFVGIGGGDGVDTLTNQQGGIIGISGSSDAYNVGVALNLSGANSATATSESVSRAAGLDGGADNDTMLNAGQIVGSVNAITDSLAVSVVGIGANGANANARSLAEGAALAGGSGDDQVTNRGNVNLTYAATGNALAIGVSLSGVRLSDASVESATDSAGLRGDDGTDVLNNFGNLSIVSNATTRGQSVSAGVTGVSIATASSVANLNSAGLSGGAGNDTITNHTGALVRTFDVSRIDSDSLSITVGGVANADARSIARSNSAGISGGMGNDTIANAGTVDVIVQNVGDAASASINVTGAASARAGVEVDALAKGIDGGDGDDSVTNTGTVNVGPGTGPNLWMATLEATPTSLSITGSSDAQSATMARTRSTGLDGGDGVDRLLNQGQINVRANALTTTTSGSLNIFGSASGGGESGAFTEAAGIDGGTGDDLLGSANALSVAAQSSLVQGATSFSFFGGGSTNAELVAQTQARGISGGDGIDTIATDGTITVNAISDLNSTGGGSTVFGGSSSVGKVAATTTALGIDGGAGDDLIDSLADITITADSNLRMNNSNYTFGGSGDTGGILAAITEVNGITGGDGADRIGNSGDITLIARSTLNSLGDSETTFGSADDTVTSGGVSHASALSGGIGDDIIENRAGAELEVTATTQLSVRSMASTFASNGPGSDASLNGDSQASGMSGEAGNDRLLNRGSITVNASAELANSGAASTALAGVGSTSSTGNSTVVASAKGLSGGDGDDWVDSIGDIEVRATGVAESVNDAATDAFGVANDNEAGARTRSTVTAIGVDGGAGANQSVIGGTLTVVADSTSYSLANASGSFGFSSGAGTYANSNAIAQAIGVTGQAGDDAVVLDADTQVEAIASTAKDLILRITVRRDVRSDSQNTTLPAPPVVNTVPPVPNFNDANNPPAYQVGAVVFVRTPPNGERDPNLPANASGAHYQLRNTGTVSSPAYTWVFLASGLLEEVELQFPLSSFPSYAASNGAGLDGNGSANANGIATATASGFDGGAGNNSFTQFGALDVTATATGQMFTSADADGFGHSQSEATGNAVARAFGIRTGNGDDIIRLGGDVSVTATPIAQARAHASSDTLCIWFFGWWCGDIGSGESKSFVNVTGEAAGVLAGGGNNRITIDEGASLNVISRPSIISYGDDGQFSTLSLATDGEYNEVRSTSIARGVETGDGNDEIINRGDIVVEAWDLASACAGAVSTCNRPGLQVYQDGREATGIRTYGGDDVVQNFGTLRVELASRFGNVSQQAIDTGNGNDTLVLGDQSLIVGTVTLGAGDDTLELFGTPVIRDTAGTMLNVDLAGGTDTLVLHGLGAYNGAPGSIERAVKRDLGTYTLGTLASGLQSVAIEDGMLRVNSSYTFAGGGTYSTFFNVVDGTSGVFSASGDATLGGALSVERRGDIFVTDGTRWNLVHADGAVIGDFSDITLPESRPLLSFELERTARNVDVVAQAPSFSVVTDNPLLQQIATNLDGIANESADFRNLFGRLQNMDEGFDRAFKSFSPESHQATAGSALTYSRELNQALRLHLGEARTRYRIAPHTVAPEVAFSFSGGGDGIGQLQLGGMPIYAMNEMPTPPAQAREGKKRRAQAWMLGISARADYDELAGFSAFDTSTEGFLLGADHRIGDEWLVGASLASGETDIDVNEMSGGEIDTWQASVYATWFNDRWHVEGGASFGEQQFDNERWMAVGDDTRTVGSRHDGSVWSAFLGAGTRWGDDRVMIEPYLSLNYFSSDEEGFLEYGARDMSQVVEARSTKGLFGEAGFKFSIVQHNAKSLIDWHVNLGLNHDFDIGDDELTYTYHGAPVSWFTMGTRPTSESSRVMGGGVTFMRDLSALTLEYRGLSNDDHDEQYVGARLSLRF